MQFDSPRRSVAAFVLLTFGFSWGIVVPAALLTSSTPVQFAAVTVSAFGPLVAATLLTWRSDERVRDWLRDALAWRVPARWYLAALGIPLAGVAVQTALYAGLVGDPDPSLLPRRVLILLGTFPVALLLTGGNEEFGWRGFMLPQLQRTRGALAASLLVGVVWLVWHLPADLLLTSLGGGVDWSPDRIAMRLAVVPLSVILTWLYNSTDGSVLLAMLFHAGWNSMSILVPAPLGGAGPGTATGPTVTALRLGLVGFVTVVALVVVLRYDHETLSVAGKHLGPAADAGEVGTGG